MVTCRPEVERTESAPTYVAQQGIGETLKTVPEEDSVDFHQGCSQPTPSTFRLHGSGKRDGEIRWRSEAQGSCCMPPRRVRRSHDEFVPHLNRLRLSEGGSVVSPVGTARPRVDASRGTLGISTAEEEGPKPIPIESGASERRESMAKDPTAPVPFSAPRAGLLRKKDLVIIFFIWIGYGCWALRR